MASKAIAIWMFVLRIFTLAASAATVALIVTNNIEVVADEKLKFQDTIAYSYVLCVAGIAAVYTLLQLPFALYYAVKQKRLIKDGNLPELDFHGDKVISLLVASGVGAGFLVSFDFKKFVDDFFEGSIFEGGDDTSEKYYNRGIIASAVLSIALVCMAAVSVLSSIHYSNKSRGFF